MKRPNLLPKNVIATRFAALLVAVVGINLSQAYEDYSGCMSCHGDFRGSTSTKGTVFPGNNNHDMHRNAANMATACNLCHTGDSSTRVPTFIKSSNGTANNPGLGCVGCHVAEGLRIHHLNNGVTACLDCHNPEVSVPENAKPSYYGTVDTKARNPSNDVLLANTNENWSVGDFLGLDNDGNNLYDLADYAVGPYRLLSVQPEGANLRVTWLTAGGRTNVVQAAGAVAGLYSNASPQIQIPGVGLVTTNYLELGGATNLARFYRLQALVR